MTTHVRFSGALDLLEWKHRIFDLYRDVRGAADPRAAWLHWRETRNRLYRDHPQSPLLPERRRQFGGCDFYDYDPAHLNLYKAAAKDEEAWAAYLDEWVYGVRSWDEYLDKVGGARLARIRSNTVAGYAPGLDRR